MAITGRDTKIVLINVTLIYVQDIKLYFLHMLITVNLLLSLLTAYPTFRLPQTQNIPSANNKPGVNFFNAIILDLRLWIVTERRLIQFQVLFRLVAFF